MEDELISVSDEDLDVWCQLPVCGCGCPWPILAAYHAVLASIPVSGSDDWPSAVERVERANTMYDPDGDGTIDAFLYDVIGGVLDHMGATEHGGSITYAWRTDQGNRLLAMFERLEATNYEGAIVGPITEHGNGTTSYEVKV